MLDVEIARQTKGEKSLDDLMRALYNEFYKGKDKWFTEADFKKALTNLTGKNYDSFFKKYIQGTERFPIEEYLGYAGFAANDANAVTPAPRIGMRVTAIKGGVAVAGIEEGGPAYKAGIYHSDVILLVNGAEATQDNASKPADYKIGDEITYTILRDGAEVIKKLIVEKSPYVSFNIDYLDKTSPEQEKVKFKWLKK
jgi:predicted metalloprotease with PDZ domain